MGKRNKTPNIQILAEIADVPIEVILLQLGNKKALRSLTYEQLNDLYNNGQFSVYRSDIMQALVLRVSSFDEGVDVYYKAHKHCMEKMETKVLRKLFPLAGDDPKKLSDIFNLCGRNVDNPELHFSNFKYLKGFRAKAKGKMIRIAASLIKGASSLDELKKLYHEEWMSTLMIFSECDEKFRVDLFKKWSTFSLEEIESASTIKEIQEAYNRTPPISEIEKAALIKWIDLVKEVSEYEELVKFFETNIGNRYNIWRDDEVKELTLKKRDTLYFLSIESVKTIPEIKQAFEKAPKDGNSEKVLLERWTKISSEKIASAQNVPEIKQAFQDAPPSLRESAWNKWFSMVKSPDEFREIYKEVSPGDYEKRKKVRQIWREWLSEQANRADNFADVEKLFEMVGHEDSSSNNQLLLERLVEVSGEDCDKLILAYYKGHSLLPGWDGNISTLEKIVAVVTTKEHINKSMSISAELNKDTRQKLMRLLLSRVKNLSIK